MATFIARAVGGVLALFFLIRGKKGVSISFTLMKPDLKILRRIWEIGIPSSAGMTISSFGFAVMQGSVNVFGPAVIAAMGIGNRVQSLFYLPSQGITQGVAILAGNALGKGDAREAKEAARAGILLSGFFVAAGMILVTFFGASVVRFFVDDPSVVQEGVMMFRLTAAGVVLFSLFMVMSGAFQAGGRNKGPYGDAYRPSLGFPGPARHDAPFSWESRFFRTLSGDVHQQCRDPDLGCPLLPQ